MVDRSALVSSSFESSKSFERRLVWVVKCAECGKVYGNKEGVVLFSDIERALEVVVESKDWWLVRDCGVYVLCYECVQRFKNKKRMEDEATGDVMFLV
jgi:hypothetical protein